jgi:hypothetical protein
MGSGEADMVVLGEGASGEAKILPNSCPVQDRVPARQSFGKTPEGDLEQDGVCSFDLRGAL